MGSVSSMMSLIPGMPKDLKQASSQIDDRQIGQIEAIIRSMTPKERPDPSIIDGSRRVRIANGSGTATSDVNALLKQFKEMQKMMKGFGKGGMGGALSGLGGMFGRGGPKLSPQAMAEMAELGGPAASSPDWPAWGASGRPGRPRSGHRSTLGRAIAGTGKAKGKGGKKGKGGGRVTPKAR